MLTVPVPVSRVALPVHAHQLCGHELLPVLMEPGTYAVDLEPSGPPWRLWAEVGTEEAETRGVYAPVYSLPYGPAGEIVVAPGDVRGTVLIPDRCDGYCLGLDGRDGLNLACERCGRAVATRIDDCSYWQAVWLDPQAVRRLAGDVPDRRVFGWDELRTERPAVPPVEPPGTWSPIWEAAVAEAFRRTLDTLLPSGPPVKNLALAGPGLHTIPTDIALVPQHPQTAETWQPSGAGVAVPLAADVWTYLAFHHDRRPVPGAGAMPDDARRDDPPLLPVGPFRPDFDIFLFRLARLAEVRQPWLRAIYDNVRGRPFGHPF